MIATANRIFVNPEYAQQFEARFKDRAGLVDTMPGFVANHVLRPTSEGAPYVVLTFWELQEQFQAWVDSPEFKQGHARSGSLPPEAFAGRNQFEMFDVLTSTATS